MMIRTSFLVMACLIFQANFGNSQSLPERIRETVDARMPLDSVYNFLVNENPPRGGVYDVIRRNIDGGHVQLIAEYRSHKSNYNILIQSDINGIYLAVVNTVKPGKETGLEKNKFFYTDPERLTRFIALHDSIYHSSLTAGDFKQFVMNRYGRACGFAATPTPKYSRMMQLVDNKDVLTLRMWLKNADYETKTIAATGLQALQMQKIILNMDDLLIIAHLKRLDIPINYCSGCTDWQPKRSSTIID
jgi:hypothetical protein